ncbi:tetratricopeptide repeat domain 24 [Rhinolophus ferrumequinum]|uniref:Tetratricopeptide repeat domain 24 n=1 Tax=Rhinolophus ferrumequinum TaxID=59479 RepID=A0A7J7SZW1_RHIFE|nr:tetratricopeptide repeat domain 24 [Rhinolophus ferrumequinum]
MATGGGQCSKEVPLSCTSAPRRLQVPGGACPAGTPARVGRGPAELQHRSSGGWEDEELEVRCEEEGKEGSMKIPVPGWLTPKLKGSRAHLPCGGQGPPQNGVPWLSGTQWPPANRSSAQPKEARGRGPQRRPPTSGFCRIM